MWSISGESLVLILSDFFCFAHIHITVDVLFVFSYQGLNIIFVDFHTEVKAGMQKGHCDSDPEEGIQ